MEKPVREMNTGGHDAAPNVPVAPVVMGELDAPVAEEAGGLRLGPIIRRCLFLSMTALVLYLLAPKLGEVFGSWEALGTVQPLWIVAMIAADAASFWFVSLF